MPHKRIPAGMMVLVGLLLSAFSAVGQAQSQPDCLSYEPAVVRLRGILVRKTFPGPPNYESIKKGDRPEAYWLLDLLAPVCINAAAVEPDLNPARNGVHQIQLVVRSKQYSQYKSLLGKRVVATGTLFGQHTGHHHTPVLLTLRTLEEARN